MATPKVTPFPAGKQAPGLRNRGSRMTHLTPDELLSVLKAARARSARDWAMVLLAYRHGLRASEVCGLKVGDMDLKTGSRSPSATERFVANDPAALQTQGAAAPG